MKSKMWRGEVKRKLLMVSAALLVLCVLLLPNVPVAEASITKNVNFKLYYNNDPAMNVALSITYDLLDGGRTVYAKEVKVTFQYIYAPTKKFARFEAVILETGKKPWNSPDCVTQHWIGQKDIYSYYGDPPKTYTKQPNVYFQRVVGQKGAYGIWLDGVQKRLIADGNYMWVGFTVVTDWAYDVQIAWQFYYGNDLGAVIVLSQEDEPLWEPGR